MNSLKAYASLLFFSGFAAVLAFGVWEPPADTGCVGHCPAEALGAVIAMIGPLPAGADLFCVAIASFFYWKARG